MEFEFCIFAAEVSNIDPEVEASFQKVVDAMEELSQVRYPPIRAGLPFILPCSRFQCNKTGLNGSNW
jgi:hypothetical protein